MRYTIKVKGLIGPEWSEWFGGLAVSALPNGETVISGDLADEAALYGLLAKVRDLGLPLRTVQAIDEETPYPGPVKKKETGPGRGDRTYR